MTSLAPAESGTGTATTDKIQVMVVDDSAVVRGLVSRWVDEDPDMETCGRFPDGKLAVSGIVKCNPDVVILDIEMPIMDGMTALPELLKLKPDVRIIIASTLSRRNAEISLKALSLGATDYIPKPESNRGVTTSVEFRNELLRKVKAVAQVGRAGTHPNEPAAPRPSVSGTSFHSAAPAVGGEAYELRAFSAVTPRILAIGSSTGGPQALAKVIAAVAPAAAQIPIIITQHMPPTFTAILAEHLGRASGLTAREGEDGEKILPGNIYVAPGGLHMAVVEKDASPFLHTYDGPMVNFCKPAVDPLFESIASIYGRAALALVLTGMGHDGAHGAKQIADAGGSVIAQDRSTSVVWGMPGAAVEAGACAAILPLEEIGPKASTLLRGGR